MTSRGQCPRGGGGAPGVPPIQVQTPPPPTWLAGYGPAITFYRYSCPKWRLLHPVPWWRKQPKFTEVGEDVPNESNSLDWRSS